MLSKFFEIKLLIKGANLNVLVNEVNKQNFSCLISKQTDTSLIVSTYKNNFPRLIDLLQKKCYSYTILKNSKWNLFNFLGILGAILLLIVGCWIFSNFCWGYKINAENDEIKQQIADYLDILLEKSNNFAQIDTTLLENELLNSIPNLGMVNISRKGVFLIVNSTNSVEKAKIIEKNSYKNGIFANQEGVVSRIFVTNGTGLVKAGDTISLGQMLVAPYVLDAEGNKTETFAQADVYLYVWDSKTVVFETDATEFARTGNTVQGVKTTFLENVISSVEPQIPFEHYQTDTKTVFLSEILPLKMEYTTYYETEPIKVKKDFNAEKDALIYQAKQELLASVQAEILEERYSISNTNSTFYVTYYIKKEIKVL